MSERWLTVSDLAEQFGIPHPTIRRYLDRHGHRLHTKKHHKSYLISEESIPLLVRIREGYADGMNSDQVETLLASSGAPTIITVSDMDDQNHERMSVNNMEVLSGLEKVNERFDRQDEFNRQLIEALEQQHQENQRQREADLKQIEWLTELLIQQKEAAAALPDPVHQRHEQQQERLIERLTERRVEQQLRAEALRKWNAKPEAERLIKSGWFKKAEENVLARDEYIRNYVDEHYEQSIRAEYDLDRS